MPTAGPSEGTSPPLLLSLVQLPTLGVDEDAGLRSVLRADRELTCTSLRDWNACSNSINFLLTLWSRMACANRYVQLSEAMVPNSLVLHQLLPRVVEAYVEGRLNQVSDENGREPAGRSGGAT